jgi:hypothetical protein
MARNRNVSPLNRCGSIPKKQLQAWNNRKGVSSNSHLGLPLLPPLPSCEEDESSPTVTADVPCQSRAIAAAHLHTRVALRPPLFRAAAGASPTTHPYETPTSEPHCSCRLARHPPLRRSRAAAMALSHRERERVVRLDNQWEKERWRGNKKERKKEKRKWFVYFFKLHWPYFTMTCIL